MIDNKQKTDLIVKSKILQLKIINRQIEIYVEYLSKKFSRQIHC